MFRHYLSDPGKTGAVCASSLALARMITSGTGLPQASAVAEIGPGTGAFTGEILRLIPDACRFFAVEINPDIVKEFSIRFPDTTIYAESAANLCDILQRESIDKLDVVISGLPWACFPPVLQDEILSAITASLVPGGCFATFSYLKPPMPKDMRFRRTLQRHFREIERTPIVWKNLPPAFVLRCRT